MNEPLASAMAEFQRCIVERDREAASDVLDDDYALVLVHPTPAVMARAQWLAVLPDYLVRSYEVDQPTLHVDGGVR